MTLKSKGDFHGSTLSSREVAGFALREIVHQPGVKIPKHSHDRAHVGFVLRGAFIERCEQKTLECKPLSVSFLAPGVAHSDEFHTKAHCFVLEFAPQRYERVREHLRLNESICFYGGSLASLTLRLYYEARQMDTASSLAIEGLALEILAEATRKQMASLERKPPRWLEQAKELLHAHFTETLTHDMIADLVGVHPVHLASTFRQHYRCTIGEYVRHLRIEFACRMISSSEASLADIALAAGFFDQSHFSKAFKQLTGMTPSQFRTSIHTP
jgi:AraC family transcriptional regulator